jgi:Tol biopolymer transport system component
MSGAPRRWSMVTRRWGPLAGGAAIAVAATTVFLAREPAPPPLPDRVQLTLTGNAIAPSLSPDGTRFAFAEKQCDQVGSCTYQLVIQDQDGTGRLILTRNIGYIYKTQWTSDGRFLTFAGSHPPLRHGSFAVSTLGGETRFLGSGAFDLLSGDTALLQGGSPSNADRWWAQRVTIHDGRTFDSIAVHDADASHYIAGLTIPDRILVSTRQQGKIDAELRLADFRGRVIDRFTPRFASHGRSFATRWVPSQRRVVIAAQRELGGSEFDVLAMKVTASAIERGVDTVLSGVELGNGIFDVSPDGERLVYFGGPVEAALSTIDIEPGAQAGLTATQHLSSTASLRGRISPAGDRILLARDTRRGGAHASQLSLVPRTGGTESQIPGVVENLLDVQWSPDGRRILYLHGIGGSELRLMETDSSGRGTREITRLDQAAAVRFCPLPDGAVCLLAPQRRSLSIIGRSGKPDVTWPAPEWIGGIGGMSHGADSRSVIIAAMHRSGDSVVVATVDIETGRFSRLASFAGSDPELVGQAEDGAIVSVVREPQGAWAFHRIRPGRRPERIGTLPHSRAEFSVSRDGKHIVLIRYTDRNDVYMIRNFGRLLRR